MSPEVIEPRVAGTLFAGGRIHCFATLSSTNAVAMKAASAGAPEGSVYLAEEQTAGRGRGGHSWHSEPGAGIYCSVVLRPKLAAEDALVISLMTGVAAASAIEEVSGLAPDLRWPNDLLLARAPMPDVGGRPMGSRKFCGILTELSADIAQVRHVVVGIGINVNQEGFPPDIAEIATSLRVEAGRTFSRVEVVAALLRWLDREYRELTSGDIRDTRTAMFRKFEKKSSYGRGLRVRVEETGGYEGVTDGLDERGFLRIKTERGVRTVLHGGVRALTDADADHF